MCQRLVAILPLIHFTEAQAVCLSACLAVQQFAALLSSGGMFIHHSAMHLTMLRKGLPQATWHWQL